MTALTIENPAYFDRLAEIERRHWWTLGMWRLAALWLGRAISSRRGLLALDLGCGTGETALRLSRLKGVDRVIGIDPSPDALAHAQRRHGFPLLRGSATAIPLSGATCDVVTCFDVFQHLPPGGDLIAAAEIARVLAPGGLAVIRSNGRGFSGSSLAYRIEDLVHVLQSSGLRVRRASYANCLPALAQEARGRLSLADRSRNVLAHPNGGGLRIRMPPAWRNHLMAGVSQCEALLTGALGVDLPFGHSTMALVERSVPGAG